MDTCCIFMKCASLYTLGSGHPNKRKFNKELGVLALFMNKNARNMALRTEDCDDLQVLLSTMI